MRATTKQISKTALTHNLQTLSALAPDAKCMAVIKANAYGHEAIHVYDAFNDADLFGVATIEEAIAIRRAGAKKTIVLLEGAFEPSDVSLAHAEQFELVVGSEQQLNWLLNSDKTFSRVWFKLDTGMGRLGFQYNHNCAHQAIEKLLRRYSASNIVIMTHFSDADSPNRNKSLTQISRFDDFTANYPDCKHSLCGSAGVLAYPDAHRDFIRPGIALYGVSPFSGNYGQDHGLAMAMSLSTRVLSVKTFDKGEPIGYGENYRLPEAGKIAICEVGYADGYSRFIPSGAPILINGREYQVAGRVAMDMVAVSVDDQVNTGDVVLCWGKDDRGNELPIERLCEAADTIPHQLLTTVTERPRKVIE